MRRLEDPLQKVAAVVEAEHVVVVLDVVLEEQRVQLLKLLGKVKKEGEFSVSK